MEIENNEKQSKNFLVAVALSGLVLIGWNYFFPQPVYTPKKEVFQSEGMVDEIASDLSEASKNDIVADVEDNHPYLVNFGIVRPANCAEGF